MEQVKKKRTFFVSKRDVDMTEGNIIRHLITFALPIIVGNAFQQLYHTFDTWVLGEFVSNEAYAAVGSLGPVTRTFLGFFTGLSVGAGVVVSQYYGAGDREKVNKAVHTSIVMAIVFGILFTVLGGILTPILLDLSETPESVRPDAEAYLAVYFAGIMGLLVYNISAGLIRAVGDSKRPLIFLIVSSVSNIILDLIFVVGFGLGVRGVAYATVIAQTISAILALAALARSKTCITLRLRELKLDWPILGKIVKVGLPASIQTSITSFSNVFVQSYINFFGPDFMSGWTAYNTIDAYALLPMQSISQAATVFVGQNLGKGDAKRAKRGANIAAAISAIMTVIICIPIMIFAPHIVHFLNKNGSQLVIDYGTLVIRWLTPFLALRCINLVYGASLRGAGNSRAYMIISLSSFVVFRRVYLYVIANFISNTHVPIALSYPAGWIFCSTLVLLYYRRVDFAKTRIINDKPKTSET